MSTISWYETVEGKLAMALALLLLVLALLIGRADLRMQADPQSDATTAVTTQTFQEKRANNLAELPPLSPIDVPKPIDTPADSQASTPKSQPITDDSKSEQSKSKKRGSFFTFWLP